MPTMLHQASAHLKIEVPQQPTVRMSPCRHGVMMYFPHDFYIGGSLEQYGEYNHDEAEFLKTFISDGDFVVEAGANIGTHTVPMAKWIGATGKLIAFEPQRVLFQMMCGNLAANALWNVLAVQEGLSDRSGIIGIPKINYLEPGNFGGVSLGSGAEQVATRTLDSINLPKCNLIKIDVEGMEASVICGAINTINKFKPVLYVENDREDKSHELVRLIDSLGYNMWWHTPALYSPNNFRNNKENIFGNVVSVNMLCLPKGDDIIPDLEPVIVYRQSSGVLV
jgi:FkbM family methyltransferase